MKLSAKLSLFIFVIAFIIWLGGINIRAMVGFDLLQTGTLDFKSNIHPFVERAVFGLIVQTSFVVDIAYAIAWLSGIIFLSTSPFKLREHGWLMMSAILFYIFTPVEVYAIVLYAKMMYLDFLGSNDLVEFRKIFIHRLAALSGVPMIALLCYYTMLAVLIFQPLKRKLTPVTEANNVESSETLFIEEQPVA
ncbi:MAG: hypothetical protein HYZ34_13025 [Ignavibacteriae bacterium]|nr:hypothetical protein [Ignavibacteriota bacterium]